MEMWLVRVQVSAITANMAEPAISTHDNWTFSLNQSLKVSVSANIINCFDNVFYSAGTSLILDTSNFSVQFAVEIEQLNISEWHWHGYVSLCLAMVRLKLWLKSHSILLPALARWIYSFKKNSMYLKHYKPFNEPEISYANPPAEPAYDPASEGEGGVWGLGGGEWAGEWAGEGGQEF